VDLQKYLSPKILEGTCMKNLTGKKFEAIRPEGCLEFYVVGWHKIKLGQKVKVGKKDEGYQVAFIAYSNGKEEYESKSYYGKGLYCIDEETLAKHFRKVK
jgi:hypothetical protein